MATTISPPNSPSWYLPLRLSVPKCIRPYVHLSPSLSIFLSLVVASISLSNICPSTCCTNNHAYLIIYSYGRSFLVPTLLCTFCSLFLIYIFSFFWFFCFLTYYRLLRNFRHLLRLTTKMLSLSLLGCIQYVIKKKKKLIKTFYLV